MSAKNILMSNNGIAVKKMMSFEELYEAFFKSIQKETWKMVKIYSFCQKDETEQEFTEALWKAYETYDVSKELMFSTHLYWQFKLARKGILDANIGSAKAKFEKSNMSSIDATYGDSKDSFANQIFENDDAYNQMQNNDAATLVEGSELLELIFEKVGRKPEIVDMVMVLIDKKDFSIADYAAKHNMSRMGANKRKIKLVETLKTIIAEEWM